MSRWGEEIGCDNGFFLDIEVMKLLRSVVMYWLWYALVLTAIVALGILKKERK